MKDLNWSYRGRLVLKDINLKFERGKFYTILGPNGSGKTTLIKNISRILENKENTIILENKNILEYSREEISKKIAIVPQYEESNFDFTVKEIVLMGRTPYVSRFRKESLKDIEISEEAMKITNTLKFKERLITELSGGEKQRVIVARAITQDTEILILDEPTSHIDIKHQIEILDMIKKLQRDKNVTIIAILHDLNLAINYSDKIILLKEGKIIEKDLTRDTITKENIEIVYNIKVEILKKDNRNYIYPIIGQF